ncbi:hypothetical protein HHI36_005733 [Cryptolaemus montrouzieri]|uniref:Bcl-2 Bcl-2 homology region 1-3 domain-containing protein n=1 Tax=Cryptolaemus montrouzieri TaxID=559131 RepID=A0ABD2NV27_9CUCU
MLTRFCYSCECFLPSLAFRGRDVTLNHALDSRCKSRSSSYSRALKALTPHVKDPLFSSPRERVVDKPMEHDVISDPLDRKLLETFTIKNRASRLGGRKFSTPAALINSDRLQLSSATNKRRFSNVGDVVSRKLSTTIGWRSSVLPSQEVILAGRTLSILYIRNRLKRAGLFTRKIGLNRPRVMIGSLLVYENVIKDVFPSLNYVCMEMERMHPTVFNNVGRQLSCLEKMDDVMEIMVAVGHEMLRVEPTWGKVVALFCVAGGLAVDCVRLGTPENVSRVSDGMAELLEDRVAEWVTANGGWVGLTNRCRQEEDREVSFVEYSGIFALISAVLAISYFIMNSVMKYAM